jgi:imidazolonepropionase-like amidohydrolase
MNAVLPRLNRAALAAAATAFALLTGFASTPLRADTIAIVNARIYTMMDSAPLEKSTLLISDGRIEAVGAALKLSPGMKVIDAGGRTVTPGLMNAGSQLGLVEVDSAEDTADHSVSSGPLGPAFDVEYALNPNSTLLAQARADGLTRAVTFPGGAVTVPFAGTGAVLRLSESQDLIDRRKVAMYAVTGGMSATQAGGSRSAQWILLRNALDEARLYRPSRAVSGPRDQLLNRLDVAALGPVVAGQMPLVINASRESDIRQAVQLASDYGIRVIVAGGAEAWRAADVLAARKIPVVLSPLDNMPATFDELGARLDNAAILARAGVTIAFSVPGVHLSHDAGEVIREAAGLAVANGLPRLDALKALTINPAQMFGVADHYGTLARGQDADIVIWDGDPLEPSSAPQVVLVQGKPVSLITRQTQLRDRYSPLRRTEPWPPGYR